MGDVGEFMLATALLLGSIIAAAIMINYVPFLERQGVFVKLLLSSLAGAAIFVGIIAIWDFVLKCFRKR